MREGNRGSFSLEGQLRVLVGHRQCPNIIVPSAIPGVAVSIIISFLAFLKYLSIRAA
ncbi:uncharacterized protein BDW43DRAFT_276327 [Aspergillus alliaceus]|uniref:uncharacterized protein n=1 Tax=Petromyces alliaceus TaxID=209559 RepID=UPI0012A3EC1E|nr:uncharacterized protein BDW43DRAFT_276327 [Aspergillus alliaceus]KAB8233448.1 hypothetical protein BDW43DRAFT_276327 [Aspergillus alliaceus]